MRGSSQSHQPAGVSFAHPVLHLDVAHDCPKSRRHYQFFESTSFNARLSSVSSATTCFSIAMICSSLCRVPFMVVLLSWFGRTHILGGPVFGGYVTGTCNRVRVRR